MSILRSLLRKVPITMVLVTLVFGCSPNAKKARVLERADRYFKAGEYDKAKIEYLNLLRLDPQNATAVQQLGAIWFDEGAPLRAAPFLLQAKELAPNNLYNRVRLARLFLSMGQVAEAKKEALAILQQSPASGEALIILTQAAQTPEDIDTSTRELQKFPEKDGVSFQLASANLALRKGDLASAQNAVQRALTADRNLPAAHLAIAALYFYQNNPTQGEKELKAAAELAPARSAERLKYAEFRAQTGASSDAKAILNEITHQVPDYLPAWCLLSQIALNEKNYDASLALLENVFGRDPDNIDARLLQAKIWLGKGNTKKAIEGLERLDKAYPALPLVKYEMARAYLQDNKTMQAIAALNQATAANPNYADASLLLAELNLRTGHAQAVADAMFDLLKNRPDLTQAQLLLADAYQSLGRLDEAASVIRAQIKNSPKDARAYLVLGLILRQQNKTGDAREAFEKAGELAPDNPLPAEQLVQMDLVEKKFDAAKERVQRQLQKTPKSAAAHFIEAEVYAAESDWDRAEAALRTTLELNANLPAAYDLLVNVYVAANKLPQAISELQTLLSKNPDNTQALMMLALIYDRQNDFSKTRDAYEKLLSQSPDFVPALNNLAYSYAERFNRLDKAAELARKARTLQPSDASIADTLGWILYKQGDYQQAVALLEESAAKLSDNPEVQFHRGMANYMMGQTETARAAFLKVASAPGEFPGKKESQRRLALLEHRAGQSKELSVDELEMILKEQPNDLIARMRLGEEYEKERAFDKAATAYDETLKVNPKLLSAITKLAQLNAGPLQDKNKALLFAKKARELAPTDPHVAAILGKVAYDTGNFTWANSLLQESARQLSNDANVLHDFAWAVYSLGRVGEAKQIMQRALQTAADSAQSEDAKSFLALTALDENSTDLFAKEPEIQQILKKRPDYVPALMARGAIHSQRHESKAAAAIYERILRQFPEFAPAQKHLASVYLSDPAELGKAYELAMKARNTLPDDPELAQTLAEISYEKKEYRRALQLLQESARKKPLNSQGLFYLGMSHLQVKQKAEARKALDQALAAGLQDPFETDAKRAMAELQRN